MSDRHAPNGRAATKADADAGIVIFYIPDGRSTIYQAPGPGRDFGCNGQFRPCRRPVPTSPTGICEAFARIVLTLLIHLAVVLGLQPFARAFSHSFLNPADA
jgi:hypothetical protein